MQNHSQQNLQDQIAKVQQQYYTDHSKNRFFKSSQKQDCARQVCEQVDLTQMINMTYFNIPNTPYVYFNYALFKTFATVDIKDQLYTRFCSVIDEVIQKYNYFEMHCNLQGFTVSAAQRYYSFITSSIDENQAFSDKMTKLVIYHSPSVIEQIVMLLRKSVSQFTNRAVFYSKNESEIAIKKIFENV